MVTTKAKGWQKLAWELARTGKPFEVHTVDPGHILFLQELCAAYKCKHRILGNKLQLTFPATPRGA